MKRIIVGITGASGSILAKGVISSLLEQGAEVHVVATKLGDEVFAYELDQSLDFYLSNLSALYPDRITRYPIHGLFSPIASGSFDIDAMVVVPCSMGTLGKIAHGTSDHLLGRAADVCLKEKRPLVLVVRETPLSSLHLENMLSLSRNGAVILPPVPAFYNKPQDIDTLIKHSVSRILRSVGMTSPDHVSWTGPVSK